MTRAEHLAWAKWRALRYVDRAECFVGEMERGELLNAFNSICSDLDKNDELRSHPAREMGTGLMAIGDLDTPDKMRRFIEGFK